MPPTGKIPSVAAAVTALSTMVCCLPGAFAAAAATTSAGLFVIDYQGWFLGASLVLLAVGALQLRYARRACSTAPRRSSVVVLCVSAVIVLMTMLFPQVLAGLIADWTG
jgi:hypothetical protein